MFICNYNKQIPFHRVDASIVAIGFTLFALTRSLSAQNMSTHYLKLNWTPQFSPFNPFNFDDITTLLLSKYLYTTHAHAKTHTHIPAVIKIISQLTLLTLLPGQQSYIYISIQPLWAETKLKHSVHSKKWMRMCLCIFLYHYVSEQANACAKCVKSTLREARIKSKGLKFVVRTKTNEWFVCFFKCFGGSGNMCSLP